MTAHEKERIVISRKKRGIIIPAKKSLAERRTKNYRKMKYCNECKVYVNEKLSRCPLCGAHVSECRKSFALYEKNVQPYIDYPKVSVNQTGNPHFLRKKSLLLIAAVILVCVWINFTLTPESVWSAYTALSLLLLYFGIIRPVFGRHRLYLLLPLYGFLTLFFGCLFDIICSYSASGNLDAFGISTEFVAPSVLLALIITTDVLAVTDKSKYKYYIVSLIVLTLLAVIPQTVAWLCVGRKLTDWLSFSVLTFAVLNIAVFTIVYWKKMKTEVHRKFFI